MRKFSELLDDALSRSQRSNRWLAGRVGMHPGTIGNYRRGSSEPSLTDAARIAEAVGFDLTECYGKEVDSSRVDGFKGITTEGVYEFPMFSSGAELLAAAKESRAGYSVNIAMATDKQIAGSSLKRDEAYAVKVDHLFDCDEEYNVAIVWPYKAPIKESGIVLFTTDPPSQLFLRRVILHEGGKFVFKKKLLGHSTVQESEIIILGEVKFKGEWI